MAVKEDEEEEEEDEEEEDDASDADDDGSEAEGTAGYSPLPPNSDPVGLAILAWYAAIASGSMENGADDDAAVLLFRLLVLPLRNNVAREGARRPPPSTTAAISSLGTAVCSTNESTWSRPSAPVPSSPCSTGDSAGTC